MLNIRKMQKEIKILERILADSRSSEIKRMLAVIGLINMARRGSLYV